MNSETNRYKKLMELMSPCSEETYYREDALQEMKELRDVIIKCTYAEEHATNMKLTLYDVLDHLNEKNEERNHVADQYIEVLNNEIPHFYGELGKRIAGYNGESKVKRNIYIVKSKHLLINNVELADGFNRGELDTVVITPKAIFIIEVKNPSNNMIIDARGNFFQSNGYMDLLNNIGDKMNNKEYLLKKTLEEQMNKIGKEANVVKLIVCANNKIKIMNRNKYIETCCMSNLPYYIDAYKGKDLYSDEEMNLIRITICEAEDKKKYPLPIDAQKIKENFAMAMAMLEENVVEQRYEDEVVGIVEENTVLDENRALESNKVLEEKREREEPVITAKYDWVRKGGMLAVSMFTGAVIAEYRKPIARYGKEILNNFFKNI
ncbi:MAG: NERD domain-containing protein [Lachnospiraceae bacterium]|nr:NERD domain-containing protein [Lachnospiraceae bacterium]